MSKEAYYFSHDDNARNDIKIRAMRKRYGMAGYGRWWVLIELLRSEDEHKLPHKNFTYIALADEFDCDEQEAKKFVADLIETFDLLHSDQEFFWSESLMRRMDKKEEIKQKRRRAAQKRWNKDGDTSKSNANECKSNAKSSKGKERKGKEIKGKEKKDIDISRGEENESADQFKRKHDTADAAKSPGLSLETKLSKDQGTPKSWAELTQMANKASNNDLPDFVSLDDIEEDEVKVINLNPSPKDRKEAGEQMAAYYKTEAGKSVLEVMCYAAGVPFDIAAGFMDRLCVKWALKQTPYVLSNWMGEVSNLSTWIQNEYKSTAKPSGSTNDNKLKIVKNGTDEDQPGFRTSDETVQRAAELSRQRRKARKEAFGL